MTDHSNRPQDNPQNQTDPNHLLISKPVNAYLESLFSEQKFRSGSIAAALEEMERLASEKGFPIIGPLVGPSLRSLALMIGANRIFEFGSGFGYSALWFASALEHEGQVICTEGDADNVRMAETFLKKAELWQRIEYHQAWAQDVFKEQQGEFDIIYNDADKGDYPEIWELAQHKLRKGGLYIADNCLWAGRVALDQVSSDPVPGWTDAIKAHNQAVVSHPNFDTFMNPARDGVLVARRR
ncbi:MAG: O-methyltransferase [Myxococcales bacterium]|nr:MAG: O-methyltransferase [Myxococcales bacterium]